MATEADDGLVFYPAFCFQASPTHFTWVKMASVDVHLSRKRKEFEGQGIFFYQNHPIRFVCVVGVIVARTEVPRRTILTLDDSTGATVDVVVLRTSTPVHPQSSTAPNTTTNVNTSTSAQTHQTSTTSAPLDITPLTPGKMVKIKGTLSSYRSTIQIQLERFFLVPDTNAEMRFVDERVRFLVEVLSFPWELTDTEVERLRVEADEEEVRVEEERIRGEKRRRRRVEREERDYGRILKKWEVEEAVRQREAGVCREEGRRLMRVIERNKMGREARWDG